MRRDRSIIRALVSSAALILLLAVPSLLYGSGGAADEGLVIVMLVNLVLVLSLQVFAGNSGVLPFGHAVFAAIGGYAAALVVIPAAVKVGTLREAPFGLTDVEVGVVPALIIGVVVAIVIAAVLGIAACRISGIGAAILSLALLIVVHELLLNWSELTGGAQGLFGIPVTLSMVGALAAASGAIVIARVFKDSRAGLRAQSARDDELAAAAMGLSVAWSRFPAWVLSAAIGALGGILLSFHLGSVTPNEFYLDLTFTLVAFLILGGVRSITGAVVATMAMTAVLEVARQLADGPVVLGVDLPEIIGLSQICLGATIVGVMIWRPEGLLGDRELDDWLTSARLSSRPVRPAPAIQPSPRSMPELTADCELRARDLEKDFGGVVALKGVSLSVEAGEIVGVIGPNGAGKTTLLNLLSGYLEPTAGSVELDGQRIDGGRPTRAARLGIARTFQNLRLFEDLSVRDNVEIAVVMARRHRPNRAMLDTPDLLRDFGLVEHADKKAGTLAQGDRRRLEMARAVALHPKIVLLDEPTAGMNDAEAEAIATRVRLVQARLGCGVVIVDHNVGFVMGLCHRIHVLKGGREIARGTPVEIERDAEVTEAYLGTRQGRAA